MTPNHHSWHGVILAFVTLPPVLFALYFFSQFPRVPDAIEIHPSLASLSASHRVVQIYPEDIYEGGAYFDTPHGRTRYWLVGPQKGKKVVLIHGLSIPSIVWKDVVAVLTGKGYRVLVYDLYGRGYSDAPATTYDAALYATQLALLMQHVKWDKAYVAGLSMGGGIATAFSTWFPHLVDGKVALIASAGLIQPSEMSRTTRFMSSPLVQAAADSFPGRMYMQRMADSSHSNPIMELLRIQSAYLKGYNSAIASSLRDGPIRGLEWAFQSLASSDNDVLLIWGTDDDTVPYRHAGVMNKMIPRSKLVTIDGAGHDLTIAHPEVVGGALADFFKAK
ncbi:unnamed protein product [Peniophora sp. CBMAI 1063]|nr:unnamed protein product [Peniophora sp. CBMAI 1063]